MTVNFVIESDSFHDRFNTLSSTTPSPLSVISTLLLSLHCLPPASLPLSQFNSAARQLIELDKPSDSNGESGEGASSGPQSNGAQRAGEKKNSKKRHSFTSLTMSHKPMLAPPPQRHSMEISGPVLISSSNPTAAARIGEISGGLSCSAPSQVRRGKLEESSCCIAGGSLKEVLISFAEVCNVTKKLCLIQYRMLSHRFFSHSV